MRGRNQRAGATTCGRFALAAGLLTAPLVALSVSGTAQAQTVSKESCVTHAVEAEQKLGIPSGMLVAIALVESGQDGTPHPFAMSVQGRPYYARNVSDAARHLRDHRGQLRSNTYVGCMQLSVATHRGEFQPLEKIVEPRDNVFYAGQLLVRFHGEEGNWKTALARYNGSSGRRAQAYVCKIWQSLGELDTQSAKLLASSRCEDTDPVSVAPRTRRSFHNAQQVAAIN
ncbi:transglycosylase SLT domain-containing protein [Azospirillum sp. CT11-132]|uniref:transglycosylase SLT domain-containing protein n=1 Tax=unclassified Azospirillum TaxID=2630922 RepID=UPI000D604EEC|nr:MULTISPECIES: transglycosylase SLT domain-containing protein [unclassified Azospirillum]PWC62353.1 lytic transglycosylase [Azospirillum sp. TSH7]PWC68296.1 lytic transglycosylase [Azospirillum sp. TSH20]